MLNELEFRELENRLVAFGEEKYTLNRNRTSFDFNCYVNPNSRRSYNFRMQNLNILAPILSVHNTNVSYNTYTIGPENLISLRDHLSSRIGEEPYSIQSHYTNYFDESYEAMKALTELEEIKTPSLLNLFKNEVIECFSEDIRPLCKRAFFKYKDKDALVVIQNHILAHKGMVNTSYERLQNYNADEEHLILSLLPIFFKSFHDLLDEEELNIFKNHTKIKEIYKNDNFLKQYLTLLQTEKYEEAYSINQKTQILDAFSRIEERTMTDQVKQYDYQIEEKTRQLRDLERQQRELLKEQMYRLTSAQGSMSDRVEYLMTHPYITKVSLKSNHTIKLELRLPLTQWDPEEVELIMPSLTPERYTQPIELVDKIKKFMSYILLEQIAKYWITAVVELDIETYDPYLGSIRNMLNSDDSTFAAYMTKRKAGVNPHLEYYNCVGSHRVEIQKAASNKDLILLIEALVAPFKNWNVVDGTVTGTMCKKLLPLLIEKEVPCIEYEGEMISINKLIELREPKPVEIEVETPKPVRRRRTKAEILAETTADALIAEIQTYAGVPVDTTNRPGTTTDTREE